MKLPLAHAGYEQAAKELFPLSISPEEYAAREAHRWAMFSFDNYSYSDPALHAWVHRLGALLRGGPDLPSLESLREKYLSAEERIEMQAQIDRWVSGEEDF